MSVIKEHYNARYRSLIDSAVAPEDQDTFSRRVSQALRDLPPAPCRVLDYGCGRGGATHRLCEAGYLVDAIDLSEEVLALAAGYEPRATYAVIDGEQQLPFADAEFDACFSSEVIEHVFDIRSYLAEIRRVLKPGGRLLITTPYHGVIKNLAIAFRDFERHYNPYHGHIRFFTRASLARCLDDHQFRVERWVGIGRVWPFYKTMYVSARRI